MNLLAVWVLSLIEGITEFLPVSSTAHLLLASQILGLPLNGFQKLWVVVVQSGAIAAVLFLFFPLVKKNTALLKKLAFSFIPTALIGLLLYKIIKNTFFNSNILIAFSLILVGIFFIGAEWLLDKGKIKGGKGLKRMTTGEAFLIGVCQALAVVPGVSRAGAVILAMILLGFSRAEAALYSFLLAVPTIFAASGLDLLKTDWVWIREGNNLISLGIGFVVSFFVAYFCVRWFLGFLKKHSLLPFAFYRLFLGIIVLLFSGKF